MDIRPAIRTTSNEQIARLLDEAAILLETQNANPFRVVAYRRGAAAVRSLPGPAVDLAAGGPGALMASLGVGTRLAGAIAEIAATGHLGLLDRLRGETDPTALLSTVTGIGSALATRIHRDLGIETLEDLEAAAHDGRLAAMRGIGARRLTGIKDGLAQRLGHRRRHGAVLPTAPAVAELLDVDREYREKAAAGTLRKIAPRRLNPRGEAWLPVLHATRSPRHYTALFSNTPRAHQMGATHDWVVLYYDGDGGERQCTVITSQVGRLKGLRIVRGREAECERHYRAMRDAGRPGYA
jgi:hypothetical protein